MTLTTDTLPCAGCTRDTPFAELCPHWPPYCGLCCGRECWEGER